MRRHRTIPFALSTLVLALVAGAVLMAAQEPEPAAEAASEAAQAVPDTELGLQKGSVFEPAPPPPVQANESFPGDRPALRAPHPEAPPPVPHAIADFLPITRGDNACVDCHWLEEKEEGLPTPIPESHFIDYRNAPDAVGEEVVGSRWVCTACHVAQTDNPPLVGNTLTPPVPPETAPDPD